MSKNPSPQVLLVDDEETNLALRQKVIEKAGYEVLTARTPTDALELFQREVVDVAVVDYFLSGMSGDELCRRMKRIKPAVPLILFSGTIPEGVSDCPDYVVVKGGSPVELLDKIAEVVA